MQDDTWIVHAGRAHATTQPRRPYGVVNPPVYHASTVLYPTLGHFNSARRVTRNITPCATGPMECPPRLPWLRPLPSSKAVRAAW